MNDTRSQPEGGAGVAALENRIDRIRASLGDLEGRLRLATTITALIGGGLCLLMAVYFYYFYIQVQEIMTPKKIVDAAEGVVMDSLPTARRTLEKQINDSADDWAADLSTRLQGSMPSVREKLEELIIQKSGEALDRVQLLTAARFRNFVAQNKPQLEEGFRSFKKQEDTDRFVQELHNLVEQQMAQDMRAESEDMLHTLLDLNTKMETLRDGDKLKLNQEQALEREILMIAKRLQVETQAEQPAGNAPARGPLTTPKKSSRSSAAEAGAEEPTTEKAEPDKPAEAPEKKQ